MPFTDKPTRTGPVPGPRDFRGRTNYLLQRQLEATTEGRVVENARQAAQETDLPSVVGQTGSDRVHIARGGVPVEGRNVRGRIAETGATTRCEETEYAS